MGLARVCKIPISALNRGVMTPETAFRALSGAAIQSRPQTTDAAIASRSWARGPNRWGFGG